MVQEIGRNTKLAQNYIDRYATRNDYTLYHVYKNPSEQKQRIFDSIKTRNDVLSRTIKIIGANSYNFVVGYCLVDRHALAIQTSSNIYIIPLTQNDIEYIAPYYGWNPYK